MAARMPLSLWLESMSLGQYLANFVDNELTTQAACLQLDDELLINIGISLPGHRRRILSHLPTDDLVPFWVNAEAKSEEPPLLPPKKRSFRDSFIYQDTANKHEEMEDNLNGTMSTGLNSSIKQLPRPVPKPRATKTRNSQTAELKKPVPAKRSTPNKGAVVSINPEDAIKENRHSKSGINSESLTDKEVVTLSDACLEESLTDSVDNLTLDSTAVLAEDLYVNAEQFNSCDNDDNYDLDNARGNQNNENSDEEYYINVSEHKVDNTDIKSKNTQKCADVLVAPKLACRNRTSEKPKSHKNDKDDLETFENAHYDFNLKTYTSFVPAENDSLDNTFDHELYAEGGFNDFISSRTCAEPQTEEKGATAANHSENDNETEEILYEAIWVGEKKDNSVKTSTDSRDSSLMQFSPLRHRLAESTARESCRESFNLPMPSFAPPPLPETVKQIGDLLSDFDPLVDYTVKSTDDLKSYAADQLPPILPPRPPGETKSAQKYDPFAFNLPLASESPTLPQSENREPDFDMSTPKGIANQDAIYSFSADPFENVDPFQDFTPQCEDFISELDNNSDDIPLPSRHIKTQPEEKTFVTVPDVYESEPLYSEPVEIDLQLTPLGSKKGGSSLPRSLSSTSSSSSGSHRLSVIVPPPSLYELPSEPPLDDSQYINVGDTENTYSLSKDLGDCDTDSNESLDIVLNDSDVMNANSNMTPVEILPTASLSPRRKERCGYLYKQGGVKQNRGWRKRWVVFDSRGLRYFTNSQSQVSKRIVPLSSMINVTIDVKLKDLLAAADKSDLLPSNSKQFKFKLHCKNRVFLFATDSLDDCQMWSNTLMEAIIVYNNLQKLPEGDVDGGDMHDPDLAAWIKIDRKRCKYYVALKKHKLSYYQDMDDFKIASPLHEIDLKLAAVKEIDLTRLQLSTHYCHFTLNFESSSDTSNWKMAIEEAITDALGDNTILEQVKENPSNRFCADCGAKDSHWASMNLGIVLCVKCAGIHRGFDRGLSKIRSLRMDTRVWNSSLIEMFKVIGNDNANKFWLKSLPPGAGISNAVTNVERKTHIYNKYKEKLYCDKHPFAGDQEGLNEALLLAAQEDDVLLTMQILLSGAEVLYHRPGEPENTAFELAKQCHQRIQMEFLLQNGGDRTKNFTPGSEEASLVARLRAEVQHQGYLLKTGSNMKDFLRRWCVLEHAHLSYFVNEESNVEKGRIESDTILTIQTLSQDKQPFCLEISTRKSNRLYLFAAASAEDRLLWVQSIAQVFCPVSLMDQTKCKNFTIAGYSFMKLGFNQEWHKSWFTLEDRRLYFTDKCQHELEEDSVDLRRATSISKITTGLTVCDACLETGPQFVINIPDKALYFQADLARDTEKMFTILEAAVKRGGNVLEDQVLGTDDVPIIITQCLNFIEQNGLTMSGIYREAAQNSKVQNLLDAFHKDARGVVLRMEDHTVHEVCNALKRFLRNLADPLFTAHLYSRWIQTAGESDHNTKLQWYKYLLNQLPQINKLTIKALAQHLKKLTKNQHLNKMTLDNISIAFGSSLMKSDKADSSMPVQASIGSTMQLEMKVISDVVMYHEWLFDIEEAETAKEDRFKEALRRLEQIGRNSTPCLEDLNIPVHYPDHKGVSEIIKVTQRSTVEDVIKTMMQRLKLGSRHWCLHEVVKGELERPLAPGTKVMPLVLEWQKWSSEYRADAKLCLKSSELCDKIEKAFVQGKPLFAEMKYSVKKKAVKMAFEFTQSKLSFYKDVKNVSNPAGSWNVEDLKIYKGCDSRRPCPTKWAFSFLTNNDKVGETDVPFFGRAVFFSSEADLLCWLSAMMNAQHPSGFS